MGVMRWLDSSSKPWMKLETTSHCASFLLFLQGWVVGRARSDLLELLAHPGNVCGERGPICVVHLIVPCSSSSREYFSADTDRKSERGTRRGEPGCNLGCSRQNGWLKSHSSR